ncbi:uncharacterized protein J4E78_008207 [Alternaria triticimaculans]|uniref:uncharacterized protein n=1 Tax=Alternaria triticimaculans TaxID=297637 RepID=UPI0020C239DB|nr:uncharacterized protein J4E78_008207 [Alternaria triticimaculans]KAI4651515.1 hypothetical protein J4E78_008207 [Alternaria triticimaculans]
MQEDDGASDHGELSSCKGKGYLELAKLNRDHLKQVHGLSLERLNADFNFKNGEYRNLRTLEEKWRLVYRRLFPEEAEDSIPLPYANEDRDQYDGLLSELESVAGRRTMGEKAFRDGVLDFARRFVQERHSARSKSVDSAVDFMTNPPTSATIHTPLSPPVSHEDSFRTTTDDEGYCGQSPRLANKTSTNLDAYTPAAADPWSFEQVFNADPYSTNNNQEWNIRSQPLSAISTDGVTSLEDFACSSLPPAPILQSHAGSAYHGYAPSNANVSSSPTYSYSLGDHDTTSYPRVETRNPAQRTPYLSDPVLNSGFSLHESSESLSAIHPSFEEHSHAQPSLSLPSLCLNNAYDYLDMENMEHKYEPNIDEGIFDLEALHSA